MGLASSIIAIGDGTLPASFEGLKTHLGLEWITDALSRSGVATVRKRKLTAEDVVWLVVGMALYRDRPIAEIVNRLDLVLPESGKRGLVTKGAIPQARARVGVEPLRELFQTTAQHWAGKSAQEHRWRKLLVLGLDGTRLRVPDSADNREAFDLPGAGSRRSSGYPQVQMMGLMVLRSHLLLGLDFAGCRSGELPLAKPMLDQVPEQSLVIVDRGFMYHAVFQILSRGRKQRHWLGRVRERMSWKTVRELGMGDDLVEVQVSRQAQLDNPELPASYPARLIRYQRKGFKPGLLLTSLLDAALYPATEIIEMYHERWEIELGYDEIKTHALERMEAIRSRTADGVRQEIWGLAVAYNLVRREMEAMARQLRLPPTRISFRATLVLMRDLFIWASTASPGSLPKMIQGMRLDLKHMIVPERPPNRHNPRHVKIKMSAYERNDTHPLN